MTTGGAMAVTVAPDGTWLATASYDQTVRIWDAATGANTAAMRVAGRLRAVAISPTEPAVFAASAFAPYRFDVRHALFPDM